MYKKYLKFFQTIQDTLVASKEFLLASGVFIFVLFILHPVLSTLNGIISLAEEKEAISDASSELY
jgi:hypothetical protein